MRKTLLLSILTAVLALPTWAAGPSVIVVVDADRGAMLRWPLPAAALPRGGFQVERMAGSTKKLIGVLHPGTAAEADQKLSPEKAKLAKMYLEMSERPQSSDPKQKSDFTQARLSVELLSLQDPKFAEFLGLSIDDRSAPFGAVVSYTVTALSENGQPGAVYAVSPLTKIQPVPPPAPPGDLHGLISRGGIALFWSAPPKAEHDPAAAVSYEIRKNEDGKWVPITPEPVLKLNTSTASGEDSPGFLDPKPRIEATSSYTIAAFDIFGRRGGDSAPVNIFFPDFTALDPPSAIESRTAEGQAILVWEAPPNKYRKGWKLERALQPTAFGEPLTSQPLTTATFTDPTGRVGTTYYYRVSAINIRGEDGPPAISQAVLIRSEKAPPTPSGLTAELKTGRVILTWDPAQETVSGFQVQRSMNGTEWNLLTSVVTDEPRYIDIYPRNATGTMQYRVIAWSFDDTASAPSKALTVALPDTQPPLVPIINSIDGADGRVSIAFTPGGGPGDATQFYVIRSLTFKDTGVVMNPDPLPENARAFTDPDVQAGTLYFYRIVAVDAAGNRSVPSEPATVRVLEPPLTAPSTPKAQFLSKPFPRVIVEFTPPASPSVRYALERRDAKGTWLLIQGPFPRDASSAIDANPPKGSKPAYRLVSISSNGAPGPRSPEVEVSVPK